MATGHKIWDGSSIGPEPIVLTLGTPHAGGEDFVLCAESSTSGGPVAIKRERINEFFEVHVGGKVCQR